MNTACQEYRYSAGSHPQGQVHRPRHARAARRAGNRRHRRLSHNDVKALATGNPLLLDHAEAHAVVTRLERLERAHYRTLDALRFTARDAAKSVEYLQARADAAQAAIDRRTSTRGDAFTITLDGRTHTEPPAAGAHLRAILQQLMADPRIPSGRARQIGTLGGFGLEASLHLDVKGHPTATVELLDVPLGVLLSLTPTDVGKADLIALEHRLHTLETVRDNALLDIGRKQTEIAQACEQLDAPFRRTDTLAAARTRLADIEAALTRHADRPTPAAPADSPPVAAAAAATVSARFKPSPGLPARMAAGRQPSRPPRTRERTRWRGWRRRASRARAFRHSREAARRRLKGLPEHERTAAGAASGRTRTRRRPRPRPRRPGRPAGRAAGWCCQAARATPPVAE